MLNFIVLGLIPGTDIQLTFGDVLRIVCTLLLIVVLIKYVLRHKLHNPFLALTRRLTKLH